MASSQVGMRVGANGLEMETETTGELLQAELRATHPGSVWLPVVTLLENIERYDGPKREVVASHVTKLEKSFSPRLLDEIPVSARANGVMYPLTGRHRLSAMFLLGIEMAPCRLIRDMTRAEEFRYWEDEQVRRKTSTIDRFRNGVEWNETLQEIDHIVRSHGYHLAMNSYSGLRRSADCIDAVGTIQDIYATSGAEVLDELLSMLRKAWPTKAAATSSNMLNGLHTFLRIYHSKVTRDRLIRGLAKSNPEDMEDEAGALKKLYKGRARTPNRIALGIVMAYNNAGRGERLDPTWAIAFTTGGTDKVEHKAAQGKTTRKTAQA